MSPDQDVPIKKGGLSLAIMLLAMPVPVAIIQSMQVAHNAGSFVLRFLVPIAVAASRSVRFVL